MPIINKILHCVGSAIDSYIIDIPELSKEDRIKIKHEVSEFVKDLIVRTVAESVKEATRD